MEKKFFKLMAVGVLVLGLALTHVDIADCADATDSVDVSATVVLAAALDTQPKNVSDNSDATTMAFGEVSVGITYSTPAQYMEISFYSAEMNWAVEIYTDNTGWTGPADADRGGLIGQTNTAIRVPLLWQVHDNVQTSHPSLDQGEIDAGHWTWVKDKGDPDWNTSGAYRQVLTGNDTWTWLLGYPGGDGPTGDISPVALYLGGKFDGATSDTYSTTLVVDLYHW